MKNENIIMEERLHLLDEGKLGTTGRRIKFKPSFTDKEMIWSEPEEIHTLKYWEKLGYKLKENEQPITSLEIWKPYTNKGFKGVKKGISDFYKISQFKKED